MSQYEPLYDSFDRSMRERYVPTARMSVSASVYLPGSEVDLYTGQVKPDRPRRRRTQSKRLEAERLERERVVADLAYDLLGRTAEQIRVRDRMRGDLVSRVKRGHLIRIDLVMADIDALVDDVVLF